MGAHIVSQNDVINAVFATKELAEQYVAKYGNENSVIVPFHIHTDMSYFEDHDEEEVEVSTPVKSLEDQLACIKAYGYPVEDYVLVGSQYVHKSVKGKSLADAVREARGGEPSVKRQGFA